ncbi:hypothetical protein AAMO2058_001570600 [Amorphochlora amoebiformis]
MTGVLRRLISAYDRSLNIRPIRTKIATSFTILTAADILRQFLESRNTLEPTKNRSSAVSWWDPERTSRMAAWGLTAHPITIHFWFNHLENWIGKNPVGASKGQLFKIAAKKVLVDQLTSMPVFLGFFIVFVNLSKGKSLEETKSTLKEDWFTIAKAGYSCWPVAHLINFAFVPVHWRLLYVNFVTLGFGTFLSVMASQGGRGVRTPIDLIYQKVSGSEDLLDCKESFAKVVGVSWMLAGMSMALNWRRIGLTGIGCGMVGATAALLELPLILGYYDSPASADLASRDPENLENLESLEEVDISKT